MSNNLPCKWDGCESMSMRDSKYCMLHWNIINQDIPQQEEEMIPEKDVGVEDNWQHRSEGMRCATCMWWLEKAGNNPSRLGRCRKNAPTMAGFPSTFPTDWCGQHKLDEAKA